MKSIKDEGLITQLVVVATMMPKIKNLIDEQIEQIADLETTVKFLQEECKALRGQVNELQ